MPIRVLPSKSKSKRSGSLEEPEADQADPPHKRQQTEPPRMQQPQPEAVENREEQGLASLLGGYGSSPSDSLTEENGQQPGEVSTAPL